RERHNSSSTALEERAARLVTELDAARRREAEVLRVLAASRQAGHVQQSGQGPSVVPAADSTGTCLSPVRTPFTAVSTGAVPTTAEPSIGSADSWSDGQVLQWPASAHVSTSALGSRRNSSTGATGTGAGVPVAVSLAVSTTAPGDESPLSGGPSLDAGGVQRGARDAGEREDVWGEFVCAPQGATGQWSGTKIVRPTPGSSAAAGTGTVAAGCGSAAAASGPGFISEPATSVSTDTEYNSDTEFYVDDEDDEEHRGRALAAALAKSPRGSLVELPVQLPPLLQEAQLQRRRPLSPGAVVADTRLIHRPDRDSYISVMTGAGRTPAPSFVIDAGNGKSAETKSNLSASDTTEASVVDDLEATFWGVFPVVDMKVNPSGALGLATAAVAAQPAREPAVAVATAAPPADVLGAVDLEATLSGNFPVLPQLLSTLQHHLPSLLPAEDGKVNKEPGAVDGGTYHCAVLALPATAVPFSFPGPQGSAPEWDGTSFCSGNQLAVLSNQEQEERSRSAVVEVPKELNNLASSFDFSPGAQLGSRISPPAPAQQAEPADSSMAPSDSMEGQVLRGRVEDSASTKAQIVDAGVSYAEDKNGLGDWGGSATSSVICSLPPLPHIQAAIQSPNRQVWVDLTDDGESSIVEDYDDDGAKDSAFGSGTQDGSIWPPAPAAARAAAGITPLLVPNPLFNETDEVSPPWSTAEWSTGRSPVLNNEVQTEGASLPSTPGSETRECSASSMSSDYLADCNTVGLTAAGAISYEAWNTLYDMPEEHSSPDSEARGFFHEQAVDRCHSSENARSGNPSCSQGSRSRSVESGETTPQQRRVEPGGDECRSCGGGGAQRALEAGQQTDEETGGRKEERQSSHGVSDSDEDGVRSLLAAGATLSNSERRRRQRRRMGDAPGGPPLEHPIDLLRQGWEFSGGVASPISPRSTPQKLTPADAPWQESPTRHTAPATASPNDKGSQREEQQLEQLLPLHALQRGRSSPSAVRRSGISTPSPRASPLSKSPVSSTSALGRTGGSTGAASSRRYTDMPALEASPGALSAFSCTTPPSAVVSRPLSPLEVRQRSRALLGRARSRVAELEDQCRALAASLHPSPIDDTAVAAFSPRGVGLPVTSSQQATPGLLWRSGVADQPGASSGNPGVCFEQCESKVVEETLGNGGSSCSSIALVATQPPAAPAEVVDALEDLRGDLNELEALHRLASRATKHHHRAEGISPSALTSPEPHPAGQLLAGLAGGAVATAVAPTGRAHVGSPSPVNRRARLLLCLQQAGSPQIGLGSPGIHAASSSSQVEDVDGGATHTPQHNTNTDQCATDPQSSTEPQSATEPQSTGPQPARLIATAADPSARVMPESGAVAAVGPQAAAPLPHDGCSWQVRDSASIVAAALPPAAPSPVPSVPGASSLDPALVALLQLSIQAQVQGQLGQLEAKIAELQRQNEALLAAATAASTPATPLPPHFRYSAQFGPTNTTPLPLSPPTAVFDASRGSGAVADANMDGRGQPIAGDTPAMSWSGSLDGLWLRGGRGVGVNSSADQLRTLQEAWPVIHAAWESTPSPPPSVVTASGGSQGRVPASAVSLALGTVPTAQPLVTAATSVTPADAGRKVSASAEVVAGPFSPEELSQLPPTVQLFAPPQLRAAALAAVREQAQANRHSL
ncbi:hypothetical protein VaNZ11_014521, partial [Volvox africanus]